MHSPIAKSKEHQELLLLVVAVINKHANEAIDPVKLHLMQIEMNQEILAFSDPRSTLGVSKLEYVDAKWEIEFNDGTIYTLEP